MNDEDKTKEELLKELHELKKKYNFLKASCDKDNLECKETDEALLTINLALKNSKEIIFLTDKEGIITFVNPEFTNVYGYTGEEVVGKTTPRILKSGVFTKEDYRVFWRTLLNKKSTPISLYKNKCKSGKLINIEGAADPIINDNGDIIGFMGIQRDITERKKAEKALKKSELKLRELNATKDKFFSIIAHDLKNPFNALLGFTELLADSFEEYDGSKQKQYADKIYNGVQNTNKLLENLLLWSRSQKGKLKFKPNEENIYLLTNATIKLLSQLAENKSINLVNKIPEQLYVLVDKDMLSTIIRNLVSNAVKFTPRGGVIEISARLVGSENKHKSVEISVKDNGIGIPSEIQQKLFSISESTSTKGTEEETGTGLGLILCKEFVDKHQGKIWIESEIGKGSNFIFTIPTFK